MICLVCLGQVILTSMVRKFRDFPILTSLLIILGPFVVVVFSEGYILCPNMVRALPSSTHAKDIIWTKK